MCRKDERIIKELIDNAKGEVCSRYVLGLERALDSIKRGSPKKALREQKEWIKKRKGK